MREFWRDLIYSARSLAKSPGLTAVAIVTLALGIGANAAIFSILDPLLLRKLPVQDPDSLVFLGNAGLWKLARHVDYDTAIISELRAYRHYQDESYEPLARPPSMALSIFNNPNGLIFPFDMGLFCPSHASATPFPSVTYRGLDRIVII